MSQTLTQIAEKLKDNAEREQKPKKVQLIYAFNGTGKTRLSREFKDLIAPYSDIDTQDENEEQRPTQGVDQTKDEVQNEPKDKDFTKEQADVDINDQPTRAKILYYNAYTEDLFYWDNDLELDNEPKLKIQPNTFTDWVLAESGKDQQITSLFQRYCDEKLNPSFLEIEKTEYHDEDGKPVIRKTFPEVTFSYRRGNDDGSEHVKISKGEESNFIWSIFFAMLEEVVSVLNTADPSNRETDKFNDLEYIFIDDPVSSLDDSHLIHLAADLAALIKLSNSDLKFVITTHNPLFFNILCNEFGSNDKTGAKNWDSKWLARFRLEKMEDGNLKFIQQSNDSPFSYHLHLLLQLKEVIETNQIEKYHFNLLRNILEKTATFLGYKRWEHLLPSTSDGGPNPYAKRIINFSSHSKHSAEEPPHLSPEEKKVLGYVVSHIIDTYGFTLKELEND